MRKLFLCTSFAIMFSLFGLDAKADPQPPYSPYGNPQTPHEVCVNNLYYFGLLGAMNSCLTQFVSQASGQAGNFNQLSGCLSRTHFDHYTSYLDNCYCLATANGTDPFCANPCVRTRTLEERTTSSALNECLTFGVMGGTTTLVAPQQCHTWARNRLEQITVQYNVCSAVSLPPPPAPTPTPPFSPPPASGCDGIAIVYGPDCD